MMIFDAHLDLSLNALNWNRDLTLPIRDIRASEIGMSGPGPGRGSNTVCLPEMRRGEVAICLATVIARTNPSARNYLDFQSQELASAMAQGQLAYYENLERIGALRRLRNWKDVRSHLEEWKRKRDSCPIGYILAMEGADPILSLENVTFWWECGLRVVGISHFGVSAWAHGTGTPGGLTKRGPALLKELSDIGMILDTTHLADQAFWEALDIFEGSVIASHNNCRTLVPGERQFTDDQIRAVIARNGVIGVALDLWMLYPDFEAGKIPKTPVTLENVADHIDHICRIAGDTHHVGIGSDLDGEFGFEQTPCDLNTIADLQKLSAVLEKRGYLADQVEGIMNGNWLRFFERSLPNT
jgi:membrane dipeptidase